MICRMHVKGICMPLPYSMIYSEVDIFLMKTESATRIQPVTNKLNILQPSHLFKAQAERISRQFHF